MFFRVVILPDELDVIQRNEENKPLQEVEQEKLKATAEEDEIICDGTFRMETIVEIVRHKQKTASLTVHPVVLLPELDVVQENEKNKQFQEVEQDKLKATAEEDEIICDDTFQVETIVEIVHQKHKSASLTLHPVVLFIIYVIKQIWYG
jgi:hypothetical protein